MNRFDFSTFDLPADVYADDIGGVDNLGTNFRTIFVAYSRTECGVLKPTPVFCVVRPKSSILVKGGAIHRMLEGEREPNPRTQDGAMLDS